QTSSAAGLGTPNRRWSTAIAASVVAVASTGPAIARQSSCMPLLVSHPQSRCRACLMVAPTEKFPGCCLKRCSSVGSNASEAMLAVPQAPIVNFSKWVRSPRLERRRHADPDRQHRKDDDQAKGKRAERERGCDGVDQSRRSNRGALAVEASGTGRPC